MKSLSITILVVLINCVTLASANIDHEVSLEYDKAFTSIIQNPHLDTRKRAWDNRNHPGHILPSFESSFSRLPREGYLNQKRFYSDTYWKSSSGGIGYRWNASGTETDKSPHYYQSPSYEELQYWSEAELNALSPAEKYDVWMGHFDYPTVKIERQRTSPNNPSWFGLCHSVAHARLHHKTPAPRSVRVKTLRGTKTMTFWSSDIKALLAFYYNIKPKAAQYVGNRCRSGSISSTGACWDSNPASFHILLSNLIGLRQQSFVLDVDPTYQVWTTNPTSYSSTFQHFRGLPNNSAPGTVRAVKVTTSVDLIRDALISRRDSGDLYLQSHTYVYTLELDRYGYIIGGEWLSSKRPDFMWISSKLPWEGYWRRISLLVSP